KMMLQLLLLLIVGLQLAELATPERTYWTSRDGLSDYEVASSRSMRSEVECLNVASSESAVQLVAFNASSGLCAHFRCRLDLSHCRKCRDVNKGDHQVWTAGSDCWTTVQHRVSGSVDFYRNWTQYQSEFGEGPDGNYWIGLNSLHTLTSSGARKLRILMKDWNDSISWAEYSSFSVGPESDNYRLSVSGFSGSAGIGDSLSYSSGRQFSTKDVDHDAHLESNCAKVYSGAWWFFACHSTHPNGVYKNFSEAIGGMYAQGTIWNLKYGYYYSLKEFEMMVL
uniref:Fibrinogen C-terminal domain-containing protein n=1 Tax=Macrostomum lignano TaxID=282301 RepID=A0A1I8JIW8_9PLAT